jgi:4,5-DOPA dioxygenase extradiol
MITRRALLSSAVGAAVASAAGRAAAQARAMPVAFVSHGGPMIAVDPVRGPELRAWGASLPRPSGVVALTPHWGARALLLGATGRGVAQYDFPRWLASKLPANLSYATPPSDALAARVAALTGARPGDRAGMDHTTWMPLRHMLPAADIPVLELSYPYLDDAALFALGRRLAPLRQEGVLLLASGGMTHNLASVDLDTPAAAPASWSRDFDAWAADRLAARDADALVDWRRKAPAADLAHPDDGAHFRVLLVALGAALEAGHAAVRFPSAGFDLGLSMRCVEMA